MGFYIENFHWVLYITGAFTLLPLLGFFNPAQAMQGTFGREPADDIERLVMRHWGLLVGMAGALLIWAGFEEAYRTPILLFAAIEKIAIVFMIFSIRDKLQGTQAPGIMVADSVMAALYVIYLIAA
ncbi:MAG: hypothetical protein ABF335_05100 [Alphaproteobacteria bacterium]